MNTTIFLTWFWGNDLNLHTWSTLSKTSHNYLTIQLISVQFVCLKAISTPLVLITNDCAYLLIVKCFRLCCVISHELIISIQIFLLNNAVPVWLDYVSECGVGTMYLIEMWRINSNTWCTSIKHDFSLNSDHVSV